jgi:polynucleotide 5'-hydroxyl-kinase GRC3/NOL9
MLFEEPGDWKAAQGSILASGDQRVLVLGATDAGKSTFCEALLTAAVAASRPAVLLDMDPGQKQIGPPACMTLGLRTKAGWSSAVSLVYLGATEPLADWSRLVDGSVRLAEEAGDALLVINTCGLVRGPGRRLKRSIASALQPDRLVAIGQNRHLDAIVQDHEGLVPTLRTSRPSLARRKGDGERRALRQDAFRAYFAQAPVWNLHAGLRMEGKDGAPAPRSGRLLALVDEEGRDMVLGIMLGQDAGGNLVIRAPQPARGVAMLRWTRLSLDRTWQEYTDCRGEDERAPP